MPKYKGLKPQPRNYLNKPKTGKWPDGPIVKNAPPEALLALHISTVLNEYCEARGWASQTAGDAAGISQKSMYHLLTGRSWPNLVTILRIEQNLGIQLWASQHNAKHGAPLQPRPNCYLTEGATWPNGPLVAGAPHEAVLAQHVSTAFRSAHQTSRLTSAEAAARANISPSAVDDILNGNAWPDLTVISRIERQLGVPLWAGQHNATHGAPLQPRPNCYLAKGATWPGGTLDDPPPEAEIAQNLSERFLGILEGRYASSTSAAAKRLEISEATIESLLNGDTWPDLTTIARIEYNHPTVLWPRGHVALAGRA